MKRTSLFAIAVAMTAAGGMGVTAAPAHAQNYGTPATPTPPQPQPDNRRASRNNSDEGEVAEGAFNPANISETVRPPVVAAQTALNAEEGPVDIATVRGQLDTAAAAIANQDDRFIVGQLMLLLGVKMQEQGMDATQISALQEQGLRYVLNSDRLERAQRGRYWTLLGNMETQKNNFAAAATAYQNALEYDANNAEAHIQLARAKFRNGDTAGGFASADRALEIARANGTEIPASWYTVPLNPAFEARNLEVIDRYAPAVLAADPRPELWNQVLFAYAAAARFDDQATLDMLRLLRHVEGLDEAAYREYARLASGTGMLGEAQSVIQAANAAGVTIDSTISAEVDGQISSDRSSLDGSRSRAASVDHGRIALNTADAYAGYGDYASAIELYRLALEKGGVDAGTVNLRLASALIRANQLGQAQQALDAVTGTRAGLAQFWEVWLDQQNGAAAE